MKNHIILALIFSSSFAYADSKIDTQITLFESSCIDYYNQLIERKLGEDKSPEARAKWENNLLKDYRFAKDINNSEEDRLKAIQQANLMCNVQQKMKL